MEILQPQSCDDTAEFHMGFLQLLDVFVDGSDIQNNHVGCIKNPVNNGDKLPTSTG